MAKERAGWGSRVGFVLAASGSAIGLGNIWKFPYIAGEYGGGLFVLIYLGCILLVGLPLMYAEITIGKQGQSDPTGAMQNVVHGSGAKLFGFGTGLLGIASGFLILSFYSVVAGWGIHFLSLAIQGFPGGPEAIQGQLEGVLINAAGGADALIWHAVFMAVTIFIVGFGVQKGIELASKIMMPTLGLVLVFLMVRGLTSPGGSEALDFLFGLHSEKLTAQGVMEALGHSFFTLSLGMGAMITYGSYLKRERDVVRDAITISALDTLIALMAGIAIFSIVFSRPGLEPGAGPGLMFVALPTEFASMEGGQMLGVLFFGLLVMAALTSAISLLEVVVAFCVDRFHVPRVIAALVLGGAIFGVGVASVYDIEVLGLLDDITTKYTLPIGGLLIAIVAGWMADTKQMKAGMESPMLFNIWLWLIRIVTPLLVIAVILNGVLKSG